MPDVENIDQAPSPAEAAAAQGVLSGGAGGDLPLAPAHTGPALSPPAPPANPEHSRVGGMFHAVLSALSGGQTEPAMDEKGVITEQPVHRTGGEWARRLLAGALTGMASGAAHPGHPGGAAAAGVAEGFQGERDALDRQDAQKRAQLQQNFKNAQAKKAQDQQEAAAADEGLLRKAQLAHTTTLNATAAFELQRQKAAASEESINAFNSFQKLIAADPANVDLGVFPDMAAVLAYQKEHPELVHQIAGGHDAGQITAIPSFDENGVHNGVHAALVHPSQMDRPLSEVFPNAADQPTFQYRVPGKMVNGKPGPDEWKTAAFAPGTKLGDALAMNAKTAADAAQSKLRDVQIEHEAAATEEARATTAVKRKELEANPDVDEIGRPLPALPPKERTKRYDTFTKDYVKDLNQLEQANGQLNGILRDAAAGKMTGADSVVGLFDAIGISSAPLKGRGFRINSNIVGEHTGARNIFQSAAVSLSKLTPNGSGAVVTPKQLQDYSAILGRARHDLYVSMAQEADRQGLPKDFLPKPTTNGAPADIGTLQIFLDAYGGNVATTRQALGKFGWSVPQVQ